VTRGVRYSDVELDKVHIGTNGRRFLIADAHSDGDDQSRESDRENPHKAPL
jgi:hypothetical protein